MLGYTYHKDNRLVNLFSANNFLFRKKSKPIPQIVLDTINHLWNKGNMKTKLNIRLFEILDEVRLTHRWKSGDWADASGVDAARLSELRRLAKSIRRGQTEKLGVLWTYDRFISLLTGLEKLIGAETLKKELLNRIHNVDLQSELILRTLILDEEEKERLRVIMQATFPLPHVSNNNGS
jgi:hypothetical protein